MVKSSSEWIELSKDVLTKSEQDEVFEYAEEERKNNLLTNSQVLSRKTPFFLIL